MEYNRIEVMIGGKRYVFRSKETPEFIRSISRQLDSRIQDIFNTDDRATLADAAILAALDILDDSAKTNINIDHLRKQAKSYVEEASQLKRQLLDCQKRLDTANENMQKMRTELDIFYLKDQIEKKRDNGNA